MPRFAANLWTLFTDLDLPDRFAAAAEAGFGGVEVQFPYAWPAQSLADRLAENGLQQVLINAPAGDYEGGERGLAGLAGREEEFRDQLLLAIDYALAMECPRIHVMAGLVPTDVDRARAMETFASNLAFAAEACADEGLLVLVEAINRRDVPGYLVGTVAEALKAIETVGRGNLALQYDLYHGAVNGDDLEATVRDNLNVIGHMQVAGFPGRHEPDALSGGGINYPELFAAIDEMGYRGWIGCEYRPRGATLDGFGWAAPYGIG